METDQIAGAISERLYTTQRCQQTKTIHMHLIRIVLRNHRVVIGEASLNQTALQGSITIIDLCITLIETDRYIDS